MGFQELCWFGYLAYTARIDLAYFYQLLYFFISMPLSGPVILLAFL